VPREDFCIGKDGMKNISTGEVIVGNLCNEDLDIGRKLGRGACGFVYEALHKPSGRKVAIKTINVHDKPRRQQLVNDLRSLVGHNCPFLVQFYGAMYEEGSVKFALELMDMGSLKNILELALKDPLWDPEAGKPLIPEPVMAKITQQILCGLAYLNIIKK